MKKRLTVSAMAFCLTPFLAPAQQAKEKPQILAQLQLSAEIAATTDDGQPTVLRITLENAGDIAVDLPMPAVGCTGPDGAAQAILHWHSNEDGSGSGGGCGGTITDRPTLIDRVRREWLHLRPGEFLIFTENLRPQTASMKPGTVEYWVEYQPPKLQPDELTQLEALGYVVPTEELKTRPQHFSIP